MISIFDMGIIIVTIFDCIALVLACDLSVKNPENVAYIMFLTTAACISFAVIIKQKGNEIARKFTLATRKKKPEDSLDEITAGLVSAGVVQSMRKRFGGNGWSSDFSKATNGEDYFVLCASGDKRCSIFIATYLDGEWIRGKSTLKVHKICGFKEYDPTIMSKY